MSHEKTEWMRTVIARLEEDKAELLRLCRDTLDCILDHNRRDHRGMCDGHVRKATNDLRAVIGKHTSPERCPKDIEP